MVEKKSHCTLTSQCNVKCKHCYVSCAGSFDPDFAFEKYIKTVCN